ncbi:MULTISPECIES: hypothetical protein [Eubacterium]|nr:MULTISPECIES: hypothetical protein [Eubacterium]
MTGLKMRYSAASGCQKVAQPKTAPFIQISKKVQALRITARNRAA